jgi:hypothetical protein
LKIHRHPLFFIPAKHSGTKVIEQPAIMLNLWRPPFMPITLFQKQILTLISVNRSKDSWIAGGIPVARETKRFSNDIDIFGTDQPIKDAYLADKATLERSGYGVYCRDPNGGWKIGATVTGSKESMRLEWVRHQDIRYYPLERDPDFGLVLNPIDLAHNKLDAATNRDQVRDFIDLNHLTKYIPLGPLITSYAGLRGLTPEEVVSGLQRNTLWDPDRIREITSSTPIDYKSEFRSFKEKLRDAEGFIATITEKDLGLLFLENGKPVQPDMRRLSSYERHTPKNGGHWPSSRDIEPELLAQRYGISWNATPSSTPPRT